VPLAIRAQLVIPVVTAQLAQPAGPERRALLDTLEQPEIPEEQEQLETPALRVIPEQPEIPEQQEIQGHVEVRVQKEIQEMAP
jgi:hypothetical protein